MATGTVFFDFGMTGAAAQQSSGGIAPAKYKANLDVHTNSVSTIDIEADEIVVEDSSGNLKKLTSVSERADITVAGAGGLDTGAEASNTMYYLFLIDGTSGTEALLSLSSTSPTMPSGYTYKRRVGEVYNLGTDFTLHQRRNNRVTFEDPLSCYSGASLTTSFGSRGLPASVPSGATRLWMESGASASGSLNLQVISPDNTTRFEVTTENVHATSTTNQGPAGIFRTVHLEMEHLGATSLYSRANATATQSNQSLYIWGYELEV